MADAYGLFGYPVQHSGRPLSRDVRAPDRAGTWWYGCRTPPDRFRSDVLDFSAAAGAHQRHTAHKRAAADLVNELTPRAQLADAVNTWCAATERLVGDNTDWRRPARDLTRNLGLRWQAPRHPAARRGAPRAGSLGPLLTLPAQPARDRQPHAERAVALAPTSPNSAPFPAASSRSSSTTFRPIVNATSGQPARRGADRPIDVVDERTTSTTWPMARRHGVRRLGEALGAGRAEQGWGNAGGAGGRRRSSCARLNRHHPVLEALGNGRLRRLILVLEVHVEPGHDRDGATFGRRELAGAGARVCRGRARRTRAACRA